MEFGDILKQLRQERGLSQEELAARLGTTKQVISRYETKKRIPRLSVVADYAQKLGVPLSALSGEAPIVPAGAIPVGGHRRVPILGAVACGEPIYSPGDGTDFVSVEDDLACDFALIAEGDSMTGDRIHSGDVVFIRAQNQVADGDIAAVALDDELTLKRIRRTGPDKETINVCYVIDDGRHLIGLLSIRTLLLAEDDDVIGDIMERNFISVQTLDDQETTARALGKYDFLALPVVDQENRLVGIVTVDDAMDVLQEEVTEDIEKMAAIVPTDKPYLKTGIFETFKARIPWLLLLMISATFTGQIISSFENALAAFTVLTAYIPMLMDTGGNCGSQASVTVIRGISLNEIEFSDLFRVIWKEMRVGLTCGIVLSAANFVKLMLIDRMLFHNPMVTPTVALVVCGTLVFTVFCAKLVGCTLPLLAKKIGFDPAVMASPFITTIVDAISLLIYFQFATTILGI